MVVSGIDLTFWGDCIDKKRAYPLIVTPYEPVAKAAPNTKESY